MLSNLWEVFFTMKADMFSCMKVNKWIIKGCYICAVLGLWSLSVGQEIYDTASIMDSTVLRQDIIDVNDHRFRPIVNQSSTIVVKVEFHLMQLLHVDELEGKMKTSCAFHFYWNDEIRVWSPGNYSGIAVLHPDPTDVWRPRIFITNSLTSQDVFEDNYAHLSVLWTGLTRWQPGIILTTSCNLDLRFFPYDEHVCSIWARSSDFARELEFNISRAEAVVDQYMQSGEWTLLKTEIEVVESTVDLQVFSVLEIRVHLRRHPGFFFVNGLFPTMLLSFLSIMVFVLPRSSGERAGYSMTVLLTLSLIHTTVSSGLPKTPQTFPYIVMYLFVLLILSWAMMICTVCILAWENRQQNKNSDENLCNSSNPNAIVPMEENFVAINSGTSGDGKMDQEHLKGFYDPLEADEGMSGQGNGVTHRKLVILRDFRRVHPENSDNEKQTKQESQQEGNESRFQFFGLIQGPMSCLTVHDIDLVLFWLFLVLWVVSSLVFLCLMALGRT